MKDRTLLVLLFLATLMLLSSFAFAGGPLYVNPNTRKAYHYGPGPVSVYYDLLTRERPAVVEVVAWAASNGGRSENADYQYGKRRLRQIDGRVRLSHTANRSR